jgi:2-dehydropantoate 2-reductase
MRVYVVGAGSLGSAIGGTLAADGNDVVLVTRNAAHVAAIETHGLRLDDGERRRTVEVKASVGPLAGDMDPADDVDLVIMLVKSFDTATAIDATRVIVGPETVVLTLQNGVGCEDIIAAAVGRERVIAGRTFIGGRLIEPGVIEYGIVGRRTVIGELDGHVGDRVTSITEMFRSAGMEVDISTDIVAMMWEKLFVNVATGALSALTRLPYGELSIHREVERCAVAAVAEAMAVARAHGIDIVTTDPAVPWRRAWEGLPDGFKASMLQSIEKGSRTEVDVIHGAVCRAGRDADVPTPVNDTLLAAVLGLERHLALSPDRDG